MPISYVDEFGRTHEHPVTQENPVPGNNGFIHTGYFYLAGGEVDTDRVAYCFLECRTLYGFDRHPWPYNAKKRPCSHDELVGIFMLASKRFAKGTYDYYVSQRWQICNLDNFNPRHWLTLNPFRVIRDFYKLSKEENPRKATVKYPYIWPITFWHMPQHTYFYKRCAGKEVGLLHTIWFIISSILTIDKKDNSSSKLMLGFKLAKLNRLGFNKAEAWLAEIFDSAVDMAWEAQSFYADTSHPTVKLLREVEHDS